MGRIGQAVARRARGFSMKIIYHNRQSAPDVEAELDVEYRSLDDLLIESDFVCVMVPYTKETHHLITRRELTLMKESAILINTARGSIVNEQDLYEALERQTIW
ncbi:NAD(P)-dependent oxidoreductase, partial [Aquibacillus salsiterrae]